MSTWDIWLRASELKRILELFAQKFDWLEKIMLYLNLRLEMRQSGRLGSQRTPRTMATFPRGLGARRAAIATRTTSFVLVFIETEVSHKN